MIGIYRYVIEQNKFVYVMDTSISADYRSWHDSQICFGVGCNMKTGGDMEKSVFLD